MYIRYVCGNRCDHRCTRASSYPRTRSAAATAASSAERWTISANSSVVSPKRTSSALSTGECPSRYDPSRPLRCMRALSIIRGSHRIPSSSTLQRRGRAACVSIIAASSPAPHVRQRREPCDRGTQRSPDVLSGAAAQVALTGEVAEFPHGVEDLSGDRRQAVRFHVLRRGNRANRIRSDVAGFSIDRQVVLAVGTGREGQVVRGREAPAAVGSVDERVLLRMIVAVMRHDVEDHPPYHLFDLLVAAGHAAHQTQQIIVVDLRDDPLDVEHAGGGDDVVPPAACCAIETLAPEVRAGARRGRDEAVVGDVDTGSAGHPSIDTLERADVLHVVRTGKFHEPAVVSVGNLLDSGTRMTGRVHRDQNFRTCTARRTAEPLEFGKDVADAAVEDLGRLACEQVQVDEIRSVVRYLRTVDERTHPAPSDDRKPVERRERLIRHTFTCAPPPYEFLAPRVRQAIREHTVQTAEDARLARGDRSGFRRVERIDLEAAGDERGLVLEDSAAPIQRQSFDVRDIRRRRDQIDVENLDLRLLHFVRGARVRLFRTATISSIDRVCGWAKSRVNSASAPSAIAILTTTSNPTLPVCSNRMIVGSVTPAAFATSDWRSDRSRRTALARAPIMRQISCGE